MLTLTYPVIDPVLFEVGPLSVRWYALSYIAGILLAWRYMIWLARKSPTGISKVHVDDFLVWGTLGVVLGGRLGYVVFYKPVYFSNHPLEILALWQGGMSFHGGLLGVAFATWVFAVVRHYPPIAIGDIVACAAPIGLFLGRIANFINGELYGRITGSPFGMVFPGGGPMPRHPSQLYEAVLEGLVLFLLLLWFARKKHWFERSGFLAGVFLVGYGTLRPFAELFREPDSYMGYLPFGTTMGQWLSTPILLFGIWLIFRSSKNASA